MKENKQNPIEQSPVIREVVEGIIQPTAMTGMPLVIAKVARRCEDCRVQNAFHAWRSQHLTPSFNWNIDFTGAVNIPSHQMAVIELITATVQVPCGERARLRLSTSLGTAPSNLDFVLTPQGPVGNQEFFVATHSVRVYSDHLIAFNVNRDNAQTEGDALICISGYLIDV